MVKVSSKHDAKFAEYLRSIGGKWDPNARVWDVPDEKAEEVRAKARELGVKGLKVEDGRIREGTIRMRLSKDGRFVLVTINMIAFAEDVKALLERKRKSVRFRILPPQ